MFKQLNRLVLLLLGLASPVLASPLQSDTYILNNGGFVDHISPLLYTPTQASSIINITMDDRGQLSKRNGFTVIQSTQALVGFSTWTVSGGDYHTAASGSDFFTVSAGTSVYRIGNSYSSWTPVSGATVTATTSNLAQVTHLQDFAVFCNEVDKPFYVGSATNATYISTNTFSAAKTCATYGTYLVVANTTESSTAFPSRVRWSDINNINSFPALNYIDVEPSDGDKIVGVIAWDESVYIFKHRSIYRMLITGSDGPDAFIIRPLARNIGAWSKMSIKAIPNVGIAFLAQNTAYILSDHGLKPIGDPIQRTFDAVQRSMWANAVGGVYPKKYQYWLSVSTAGTTNTETLVYDYVQSNWTTYTGLSISMMAQGEDSTGAAIFLTGSNVQPIVYKQDNGTADKPFGVSVAIGGSYTTGDLYANSLSLTKNFKYLYLVTRGDTNYNLTVRAAYDLDMNYEYNNTVSIGSSGSLYDTALYDTALYTAGSNTVTRLELNRSAKTIRLQFVNNDLNAAFGVIGWYLVYSLEDFRQ